MQFKQCEVLVVKTMLHTCMIKWIWEKAHTLKINDIEFGDYILIQSHKICGYFKMNVKYTKISLVMWASTLKMGDFKPQALSGRCGRVTRWGTVLFLLQSTKAELQKKTWKISFFKTIWRKISKMRKEAWIVLDTICITVHTVVYGSKYTGLSRIVEDSSLIN